MACGWGMPGPVFLVAIAAGLWAGPMTGLLIGVIAGLTNAIFGSQTFVVTTLITMACATASGYIARWLARRHLLVGLLTAFATSLCAVIILALLAGQPILTLWSFAVYRAGENSLWMILIYGVILVPSAFENAIKHDHYYLR